MKKIDLKKAALYGFASGVLLTNPIFAADSPIKGDKEASKVESDPNAQNMNYHLMTEEELLVELSDEGYKQYQSLDAKGKELAREVASGFCQATNQCEGLNACKTDKNDCAGKGSCKGTGKCGFSDKNLAVKVVVDKLKNKRAGLISQKPAAQTKR